MIVIWFWRGTVLAVFLINLEMSQQDTSHQLPPTLPPFGVAGAHPNTDADPTAPLLMPSTPIPAAAQPGHQANAAPHICGPHPFASPAAGAQPAAQGLSQYHRYSA